MTPPRPGSSAVVFALALPVVLGAAAGMVEYGHYAYRSLALSSVVHEAVQAGAVRPVAWSPGPLEVARTAVHEGLASRGGTEGLALDASIDGTPGAESLTVSAVLPYRPLIGFVPVPRAVVSTYGMRLSDSM